MMVFWYTLLVMLVLNSIFVTYVSLRRLNKGNAKNRFDDIVDAMAVWIFLFVPALFIAGLVWSFMSNTVLFYTMVGVLLFTVLCGLYVFRQLRINDFKQELS